MRQAAAGENVGRFSGLAPAVVELPPLIGRMDRSLGHWTCRFIVAAAQRRCCCCCNAQKSPIDGNQAAPIDCQRPPTFQDFSPATDNAMNGRPQLQQTVNQFHFFVHCVLQGSNLDPPPVPPSG